MARCQIWFHLDKYAFNHFQVNSKNSPMAYVIDMHNINGIVNNNAKNGSTITWKRCNHSNKSYCCSLMWLFLKNIFEIFLEKVFKLFWKNIYKIFSSILLRFVLEICQKYVIFQVFQIHLQVLLLFENNGYIDITLLLKVQMLMK